MFQLPFRFGYIVLCIPFGIVWFLIFFFRKDLRTEQLSMSYKGAILGPLSEIIYFRDYWMPQSILSIHIGGFPLMIEDVLFGFFIGGIAAVIYEVMFRMKLSRFSLHSKHIIKSLSILIIFVIILSIAMTLGINSIYASAIAFVLTTIPIIYIRHDLFLNAIGSGFGVMLIMFVSYLLLSLIVANTNQLLKEGWLIYGTDLGTRFATIPLRKWSGDLHGDFWPVLGMNLCDKKKI